MHRPRDRELFCCRADFPALNGEADLRAAPLRSALLRSATAPPYKGGAEQILLRCSTLLHWLVEHWSKSVAGVLADLDKRHFLASLVEPIDHDEHAVGSPDVEQAPHLRFVGLV